MAENYIDSQFSNHDWPYFGVRVIVQNVPFAQILNQVEDSTLPMFALGWTPNYVDPADYISQWMGNDEVGAAFGAPVAIDALPEWGPLVQATNDIDLTKGQVITTTVPAPAEVLTIFIQVADVDYEVAGTKGTVAGGEERDVPVKAGQTVTITARDATRVDLQYWMVHKTPGGIEYLNWNDLMQQGAAASDPAVRKDIYFTLQKLFVDNAIAIMLSQPESEFIERSWLTGYRYNPADPGSAFPVLYNPAAGIAISKAANGNGADDVKTTCATYPQAVFVIGGATPTASDCNGHAVNPIPGSQSQ